MKKAIKICVILFMALLLLTGCGKKQEVKPEPEPAPVAPNAKKENLRIIISERTKNGVVYIIKNKDEIDAKLVTVEIEFWKKGIDGADDTLIGSVKSTYSCIEADSTIAGEAMISKAKKYDYYKIFIDIGDASRIKNKVFVRDDVIVEDATNLNPTEEELAAGVTPDETIQVVLKNKSEERINQIDVAVVFYKNNAIVGYSKRSKQNLNGRTKSTISLSLPNKIEFDSYRIFINQAYKKIYY